MSHDAWKLAAAERALDYVESGMRLGLGTGSTAAKFVDLLGKKVAVGLDVVCVATSQATEAQATALGIRTATLDDLPFLDLTVDGAAEIDGELRRITGGGGALLREKIVATASGRMIVIADATKLVETLGAYPLPLEVVPFGLTATRNMIIARRRMPDARRNRRWGPTEALRDRQQLHSRSAFGHRDRRPREALKLIRRGGDSMFLGIADLAASPAGRHRYIGSEGGDA
jgi:ribose 5-phosphate isomerase A